MWTKRETPADVGEFHKRNKKTKPKMGTGTIPLNSSGRPGNGGSYGRGRGPSEDKGKRKKILRIISRKKKKNKFQKR